MVVGDHRKSRERSLKKDQSESFDVARIHLSGRPAEHAVLTKKPCHDVARLPAQEVGPDTEPSGLRLDQGAFQGRPRRSSDAFRATAAAGG